MRTFVAKPADVLPARKWWVIDAKGQPLGRLASTVAQLLRGKHKPEFTPHVATGDFVIVVNAKEVKVTGRKATDKIYYRHSGYIGGLKSATFEEVIAKTPERPIRTAVSGMLPKGPLGRAQLGKLKIYPTAEHPHAAQKPQARSL